jgi:hypothetical protein
VVASLVLYKDMLNTFLSLIDLVVMNHQNHIAQMTFMVIFATYCTSNLIYLNSHMFPTFSETLDTLVESEALVHHYSPGSTLELGLKAL